MWCSLGGWPHWCSWVCVPGAPPLHFRLNSLKTPLTLLHVSVGGHTAAAGVKVKGNGTDQNEWRRKRRVLQTRLRLLTYTYSSAQYEYTSRWPLQFPRSACFNSLDHWPNTSVPDHHTKVVVPTVSKKRMRVTGYDRNILFCKVGWHPSHNQYASTQWLVSVPRPVWLHERFSRSGPVESRPGVWGGCLY